MHWFNDDPLGLRWLCEASECLTSPADFSPSLVSGGYNEGLPPRERGRHVQQLPSRGRAMGCDGVSGRWSSD